MNPNILIGEKVFLRKMTEEDASFVVSWRNDPDIKKWMFNQDTLTIEGHLKWFRKPKLNRIDFIICEKRSNQPIGTVNYINIKKDEAEAGKMIGNKEYWGGGFAKEAFIIWLDFGFNVLGFKRIIVKTKKDNLANIGLNRKLGFVEVQTNRLEYGKELIKENFLEMEIFKNIFNEKNIRYK